MNDQRGPENSVDDQKARPDHLDETEVVNQQDTELEFDDLLKQAANESRDPFDSEQTCVDLMHKLKQLEYVRELAKHISDDPEQALKRIGQFIILEQLGEGGMGKVYKARHAQLGKIQAVKVLSEFRLDDQQAIARFRQEMRAIGTLSHPNIVAAHHADEIDGVPFLVMDYVEGQSLYDVLRAHKSAGKELPISAACEMIRQAAIGLQYAHDQGVVHRDIKPGNLMLDQFGVVRVLDLGLARLSGDEVAQDGENLTHEHQILGTPDYMSPEQLRSSRTVDARTDVYALGATLFCLLTGRAPYADGNSTNMLEKAVRVMNEPVPDIRSMRPEIPKELASLITTTLQKSPDDRIASAGELAEQLSQWAQPDALKEVSITPLSSSDQRQEGAPKGLPSPRADRASTGIPAKTWGLLVALGLVFAGVLAGIVYQLSLPDGGTLVVHSDDPNARISIKAVQGEQSQELSLTQSGEKAFSLTVGKWNLSIEGLDADQFTLDQQSVVISKGGEQKLLIKRVPPPQPERVRSGTENIASLDVPEKLAQPAAQSIKGQWAPGDPNRIQPGMVIQPAVFDEWFDWQLLPQLRMFNHRSEYVMDLRKHFDVDPTGKLFAVAYPRMATIREIESGRVRAIVRDHNWRDIRFHPDGDRVAIVGLMHFKFPTIEIRDLDGRLINRWTDESLECNQVNVEWRPSGDQLVLVADDELIVHYTTAGKRLATWRASTSDENNFAIQDHSIHPDGRFITLICSDGKLRNWDFEAKQPMDFATSVESESIRYGRVSWSGDGQLLAVGYYSVQSEKPVLQVVDSSGGRQEQLALDQWWSVAQDVAWSPDSRFLVTADGQVYDRSLTHLRSINAEWVFRPFWKQGNQIVGFNDIMEQNSHPGWPDRICRYTPSGKRISTPNPMHPLVSEGVTWNSKSKLTSIHPVPLGTPGKNNKFQFQFRWEKDGRGTPFGETNLSGSDAARIGNVSWSSAGDVGWFGCGGPVYRIDVDGKVVTEEAETPDGIRISVKNRRAIVRHLGDQRFAIELSGSSDHAKRTLKIEAGRPGALLWSPDGRWLSWTTFDSWKQNPDKQFVSVLDTDDESSQPVSTPYYRNNHTVFSPDSRWLVFDDFHSAESPHRAIILFDLHGGSVNRYTTEQNLGTRSYPAWSADSQKFFAGQLFQIGKNGIPNPLGDFIAAGTEFTSFTRDGNVVVWGYRHEPWLKVVAPTGDVLKTVPLHTSFQFLNASWRAGYARQVLENQVVGRLNSDQIHGIGVIDTDRNAFQWNGYAFHDGTTLTLDPAGNIIYGPQDSDLDQYVIHTIRYPGGREVALTRNAFLDRISATEDQKAVLWALDMGASIVLDGQENPVAVDHRHLGPELPSIDSITSLSLKGVIEISDAELGYLRRFSNLKRLQLSSMPISKLPDLSALSSLESVDLSGTNVHDVEPMLPRVLRELNLSEIEDVASIGSQLSSFPQLELVDLSKTNVDSLTLLDLATISTLKELKLVGVEVSEEDLEQLREKLPKCDIRTSENLNP